MNVILTHVQNGATCNDQVNGYMCNCVDGYTGIDCETGNYMTLSLAIIMNKLISISYTIH